MSGMDIFISILAGVAVLLIGYGIYVLNRRDLEIGALMGIYPLVWGLGGGLLAGILFAIQHVSIRIG